MRPEHLLHDRDWKRQLYKGERSSFTLTTLSLHSAGTALQLRGPTWAYFFFFPMGIRGPRWTSSSLSMWVTLQKAHLVITTWWSNCDQSVGLNHWRSSIIEKGGGTYSNQHLHLCRLSSYLQYYPKRNTNQWMHISLKPSHISSHWLWNLVHNSAWFGTPNKPYDLIVCSAALLRHAS